MPKNTKLKVFQAPFGFYDSIVAAPSQTAALKAWGSHQDLFAEKIAFAVTNERDAAAAMAHPGIPLRRAIGSDEPFELEPRSRPEVPQPPKEAGVKSKKSEIKRRPPPDRTELDKYESALREIDKRHGQEEAAFDRRLQDLNDEKTAAQLSYNDAKTAATSAMETARRAYAKSGGKL